MEPPNAPASLHSALLSPDPSRSNDAEGQYPNAVSSGLSLQLKDVGFTIKKDGTVHEILRGVSVRFDSGRVTALLGPSGAGKTSLLALLSGHASDWGDVSGRVTVNGQLLSACMFRRLGTLVPQDDVLLPGLTVRQTLTFGARLRCRGLDGRQRTAKVQSLMETLGLAGCADVLVGNEALRGVSGGQRKRCSIALELLADQPLLFLDEPTSGLDSKMAEDCAALLSHLARGTPSSSGVGGGDGDTSGGSKGPWLPQRTVVCTIHQPSFRIFSAFDSVVLLARDCDSQSGGGGSGGGGGGGDGGGGGSGGLMPGGSFRSSQNASPGRVVFCGAPSALLGFMDKAGLACPRHENPADHAMRLLQDSRDLARLRAAYTADSRGGGGSSGEGSGGHGSAATGAGGGAGGSSGGGVGSGLPLAVPAAAADDDDDDDDRAGLKPLASQSLEEALGRSGFAVGYAGQCRILFERFAVN